METYRIIRNHLIHGTNPEDPGLTLREAYNRTKNLNTKESNGLVYFFYEVETSIPVSVMGI